MEQEHFKTIHHTDSKLTDENSDQAVETQDQDTHVEEDACPNTDSEDDSEVDILPSADEPEAKVSPPVDSDEELGQDDTLAAFRSPAGSSPPSGPSRSRSSTVEVVPEARSAQKMQDLPGGCISFIFEKGPNASTAVA